MSDQEKMQETTVTPQRDAATKKTELTEEDLKQISGGTISGTPITTFGWGTEPFCVLYRHFFVWAVNAWSAAPSKGDHHE